MHAVVPAVFSGPSSTVTDHPTAQYSSILIINSVMGGGMSDAFNHMSYLAASRCGKDLITHIRI